MIATLGWDPSTVGAAWAELLVSPARREFVGTGMCKTEREIEARLRKFSVDRTAANFDRDIVIGIEMPMGIHTARDDAKTARARGVYLMKTRGVASSIATMARMLGFETVIELSPGQCRSAIGLGRSSTNAGVSHALRVVVPSWPARSNDHNRDAAVCAFAAATRRGFHARVQDVQGRNRA